MTTTRRRSFWGWGYEDEAVEPAHAEAIADLKQRMVKFFETNADMTPAHFKDMTGGASRKFLIPLLEYFDSKNVTLRVGDVRKLRKA